MNSEQAERMSHGKGFIAALDQSGGSTPKALGLYGIPQDSYSSEEEMFNLVHAMRTRIITSPAFTSDHILGAILFEQTMDRTVEGMLTGDYLWEKKGIVPFLKVDKGLAPESDGVQLMKTLDNLDGLLQRATERKIFGTKMRSVIKHANPSGISQVVTQQFAYGRLIAASGLVPIIEPEIDIHSADKAESEKLLKENLVKHLDLLPAGVSVMLKLTIPSENNFYADIIAHPHVMRVVALSGGYSRKEANDLLAHNSGLIASFSRALTEGLNVGQSAAEFDTMLTDSIAGIYQASLT